MIKKLVWDKDRFNFDKVPEENTRYAMATTQEILEMKIQHIIENKHISSDRKEEILKAALLFLQEKEHIEEMLYKGLKYD